MHILLLGSGGREHAFAHKLIQSKHCTQLYIAPGNPGTASLGKNISVSINDFEALGQFVLQNNVELVVVGPEAPLVNGIYDFFLNNDALKHIPVFGPSQIGAQLEGSKAFSKAFMLRNNIPTAAYAEFTTSTLDEGLTYIKNHTLPIVLKADGLAAGKGVVICSNITEAQVEFKEMLGGKFGNAGNKVVIEEFMDGIEFSVFVLTDGVDYKILPTAKDYKRIGEGDTGLNTGGMGAVSPPPFVTNEIMQVVEQTIIKPTIQGLQKENITYKGIVYIGLMYLKTGELKVVEYNCRMGDPETEVVFPRIESDLVDLILSVFNHQLSTVELKISNKAATTIILASGGYPENYEHGKLISDIEEVTDALVFHCGTKQNEQGALLTSGGRVLAVTALHENWKTALSISNQNAAKIQFEGKYYRRDIGFDL